MSDDFAIRSARIAALRAKGQPVTYDLCINEAQRAALLAVIKTAGVDREDAPLEYWVSMLEGLPTVEAESPGITHGFCL